MTTVIAADFTGGMTTSVALALDV